MLVIVDDFRVLGDTVEFSWSQDRPDPYLYRPAFYFRYGGIALDRLDPAVFWNIYLALVLPVFGRYPEPVRVILPEAVPSALVTLWTRFHGVGNVIVEPQTDNYRAPASYTQAQKHSKRLGLLFGGGKDSMYSLGALTELRDPHDIFLLSYVNPFTRGDDFRTRLRIRRAGLLLAHVLEQRTVTACIVETDYRANARTRDTGGGPHLAFYTASALPVVLRYGLRQLVYNYEICHYWTHRFGSETYEPYFRRSRPEFNEFTAQAYRSLFGIQFDIANLSYFLSELLTYRIVLDRYPELHRSLLMCESRLGLTDRWCNACHKCWERVMFGLHCGHVDPSIDYDGFFRESEYVQKALRLSENRPAQPLENGNHAYVKGLTFAGHFQSHCHTLARCDFGQKNLKLGREARQNIDVLRERYGNKEYPIVEQIVAPACPFVPLPERDDLLSICRQYASVAEEMPPYSLWGNERVAFDFGYRYDFTQPAEPGAASTAVTPATEGEDAREEGVEAVTFSMAGQAYRSHWNYRTKRIEVMPERGAVRCEVVGGEDASAGQYGGVRFSVSRARGVHLRIRLIGAQAIEWLCVQGCRNTKEPVLTWKRALPGADLASGTTLALLFTSGEPPRGFTRQGEGEFEQIDTVHVFIRIQPEATAGFTIESAAIVR